VIVLMPENENFIVRLGELYYTDGGKLNLATAVKYFSYVVSRNPQHPRALWGLYRTLFAQS
jgi:cytochrome c-type biogenesis protein CcmH/NrfG